jgi:hypothetical protein
MPMFALVASSILAGAAVQAGAADPIAQTAPGWSHCVDPRESDRTCQSITSFQPTGDHTYIAHNVSAIPLTDYFVEYDEQIAVVDGQICTPISLSLMLNLRFRRGDRYLTGSEAAEAERTFRKPFAGVGNVGTCVTIAGEGNDLLATIQVIGQPKPGYHVSIRSYQKPLRWIHADDGYSVRTRSTLTN